MLGVDPGLTRCGLGLVESRPGARAVLVHVEVVRTASTDDLADRLLAVAAGIEAVVGAYCPDVIAVERVFSQANVRSVMGTAQASGVAVLIGARAGLPVFTHTPTEVKAAVTGSGAAGKAQVATMVTRILGLAETPRPADASDALALAICHLWRGRGLAAGARSVGGQTAGRPTAAQQAWAQAARRAQNAPRTWRV